MVLLSVRMLLLPHGHGLPLPRYATGGSAGCDLHAAIDAPISLEPGDRAVIPCGFAMALPDGYEAQVRPRSGLAVKHGITVLNAPGTIDADYRGEIKVPLINLGREPFRMERGDRIAQMVIAPFTQVEWATAATLDDTDRGTSGFGSTGR